MSDEDHRVLPETQPARCSALKIITHRVIIAPRHAEALTSLSDSFSEVMKLYNNDVLTRNVLYCDQSNYSSRIIFSYTFTPEPNTNWTGRTVSEIWPLKIIQDG